MKISQSRGLSKNLIESRGQTGFRVLIDYPFSRDAVDIHILQYKDGKRFRLKPTELVFEEWPGGFAPLEQPGISLSDLPDAEALIQALGMAITGASEDGAVMSELKATKYHLEDMRSLALRAPAMEVRD